jgi:hypothetical protein
MSQGNFGSQKIVRKSQHWHRHGKHRPFHVTWFLQQAREQVKRVTEPMYDSVREAFRAAKKR